MENPDETAIWDVLTRESAAFFARDFEGLSACWWHDSRARHVFASPELGTRSTYGWTDIAAGFREGIKTLEKSFVAADYLRRDNINLNVLGDVAWVTYDQHLARDNPEFLTLPLQVELKILHRVDGNWKIACMVIVAPRSPDEAAGRISIAPDGRIASMNKRAELVMSDHPGLMVSGNRLRARNRAFDAQLQQRIQESLELRRTNLPPGWMNRDSSAVPLGTDDCSRPIYCWVYADEAAVTVSFDEVARLVRRLDLAADTLGLSPSQRRLAGLLAKGASLQMASEEMEVTVNTVRTHLRRVSEKTGTHDQAELIVTLLSVDPPQ